MLPTLSSVAKDGLAMAKKTIRNSRVMKGAMLLSRLRSQVIVRDELAGAVLSGAAGWALLWFPLITSHGSRRIQQAVLADGFAHELAGDLALLHDKDAVGQR